MLRLLRLNLSTVLLMLAQGITGPAQAAEFKYPIFDAHVHYSQPAWAVHPPVQIIAKFDAVGVARALVSSTPDDGTLKLLGHAPGRIAPELRPYRTGVTSGNWQMDGATPGYLAQRLAQRDYQGIGEFHLQVPRQINMPVVAEVIKLAIEKNLYIHVHSDADVVTALFAAEPRLKILWAHAGLGENAETVGTLMDAQKNLWADLSLRASDVSGGGELEAAWRAVFERHPDRFMIGSDTWVTSRWDDYEDILNTHRRWLALLPDKLAQAIAYQNAVRLFGSGGSAEFKANSRAKIKD